MGDQIYGDTIIHGLPNGIHKSRRISWIFSKKDSPEANQVFDETIGPCTSKEVGKESLVKDIDVNYEKQIRFCCGLLSPTYLANIIIISLIQEITFGFILAFRAENQWWLRPQLVVLIFCRLFQIIPAFLALLGNYTRRASLLIPFMMSQISLGSYADLQTYMLTISYLQKSNPDSIVLITPFLYMVLPILLYATVLVWFIYIMYEIIRYNNMQNLKGLNEERVTVNDTQIESLIA